MNVPHDSDHTDPPAPPSLHPPKAWRLFWTLVLLVVVGTAMLFVGHRFGGSIAKTAGQIWQFVAGGAAAPEHDRTDKHFYTCGMHPWVILPDPGLCPICHMDLTPLDPAKFTAEIAIDPVVVQNIGVRIAGVESGPLVTNVRTVGKIDYDETSLQDVNLKVAGWIEQLHVDYLGSAVAQGDPLFELYSPELFSAQQEYLLAIRQPPQPAVPFVPRVAADAESQRTAARTRLRYFGIDDAQIAELERTGAPRKTMTIRSPATGTVIRKMAVAGMRVEPGMQLYRIADLRKVWVIVAVYEYQLPYVELGQAAAMSLPYVPGREFTGHVTWVQPWTDEQTRQVEVRLEFDNADGLLKPGMFATVGLRRTLATDRTLVDRSAVIDTGERQVAFVSLGNGRFEPRELRLGIASEGGKVEVLEGLAPGELVVTSAQFLLDSESRIRDGLRRMVRGDLAGAAPDDAGQVEVAELPREVDAELAAVLAAYLGITDTLARDSAAGLAEPAQRIARGVDALLAMPIPGDEHFWHRHTETASIRTRALELAAATDLAAARSALADLSVPFVRLLRATGVPGQHGAEVEELHCPMYRDPAGGSWLQPVGEVRNPFFGSEMLGCFDLRKPLPAAGAQGGGGR